MAAPKKVKVAGHQYPSLTAAAKALGYSKQRLWQLQQKARGRCIICGKPRGPVLAERCRRCNDKWAAHKKNIYGVPVRTGVKPGVQAPRRHAKETS